MGLKEDLIRDEGERLKPYVDTVNKTTIGVGRNLTDRGITHEEAMFLLDNDIEIVQKTLAKECPWLKTCPEPIQRGVANMAFNLGWPRLSHFTKMLGALQAGLWGNAATEVLQSVYATQVGNRAQRIADLFRSCISNGVS